MNDRTEPQTQSDSEPTLGAGMDARSASRRRFTRAGIAAPVVLGSLVSRPVLAQGDSPPYNCTLSGQMSGNLSSHPNPVPCSSLGRSPGFWKNTSAWPGGLTKGDLPKSDCSFASGQSAGTRFDGLSASGASFTNAFRRKSVSSACLIVDCRQSGWSTGLSKASLQEVLSTGGGQNESSTKALGRATVASLLNAYQFAPTYPLTPKKVIEMFNAVVPTNGRYQVNATTSWDANQVKTYFESLYS